MNTRLFESAGLLCLLSLFAFSQPFANAQPTANTEPRFDIQIEDGQLSLEPLKKRGDIDIKQIWGAREPEPYVAPDSVPATIDNLTKYLRAVDTNLNIVASTEAATVKIDNLKLHAADMEEVVEAAGIATDLAIRGARSSGINNWYFATATIKNPARTVEVFNISLYIDSLGDKNDAKVHEKLDQIKLLIANTLKELHARDSKPTELPQINFHSGTDLLIVIGTPEAIEVTRKIINALPGQWGAQLLHEQLDNHATTQQK